MNYHTPETKPIPYCEKCGKVLINGKWIPKWSIELMDIITPTTLLKITTCPDHNPSVHSVPLW